MVLKQSSIPAKCLHFSGANKFVCLSKGKMVLKHSSVPAIDSHFIGAKKFVCLFKR